MRYVVQSPMTFMLHGGTGEQLHLQPGDVVQGVAASSLDQRARKSMDKAQNRANVNRRPGEPPVRLVLFKAHGVVRYAEAITGLRPTRRLQVNVPVEADSG